MKNGIQVTIGPGFPRPREWRICAAWANFPGVEDFSNSDIPRAKDAKVAKLEIYFFSSFAPFACFARDNPRLTGARSAPYENLRVLRNLRGKFFFANFAFFAAKILLLEREARKEIPHFPIGVDDVGRRAEDTLHDFLFAAGPDMAGAGEFPKDHFGSVAAV